MSKLGTNEMRRAYGGLVLKVALEGEAAAIRQSISQKARFSASFSTRDTKPLDSELCIVAFDWNVLHSIWLGRFSAETPTGRRRLSFDQHVFLDNLKLPQSNTPINVKDSIELIFGLGEGRLDPNEWRALIDWIKAQKPEIAARLDELEVLRLEDSQPIQESGQRIIAEQWEATGAAMDFSKFDRSEFLPPLERKILTRGKSFVLNLENARTLEEEIIPYEMRNVPGWKLPKDCKGGIIKLSRKGRKGEPNHELTVINANKKPLEECLGVDLIFHQSAFNSCVLVQYKRLKKSGISWGFDLNDEQLCKQLGAVEAFKAKFATEKTLKEIHEYRIGTESFFVKFVQDQISDSQSKSLFTGWYVPVDYLQFLRKSEITTGNRGGCRLTEKNVQRWFSNSDFAPLVSSGWIGTRGNTTSLINEMVNACLEGDRALVFALAGRAGGQ